MKKLLLTVLSLTSLVAFAQNRDCKITIKSPAASSQVVNGQPFVLRYEVENVGADTLYAADSIIVGFGFGTQIQTNTLTLHTHGNLKPGDTVSFSRTITANMAPGTNTTGQICVLMFVQNRAVAASIDPVATNNSNCISINLFNTVEEIAKAAKSVSVYPNPVKDVLHIQVNYAKTKVINIYDITGKLVESVRGTENLTEIQVSNYNKGFYLYEIRTAENDLIKSGKFSVAQ